MPRMPVPVPRLLRCGVRPGFSGRLRSGSLVKEQPALTQDVVPARQFDYSATSGIEDELLNGDDVGIFHPAQITAAGSDPLPERPPPQCGRSQPQQIGTQGPIRLLSFTLLVD